MKLTKSQLKQIIKEELEKLLLESEKYIERNQEGRLVVYDDEGNSRPASQSEKRQYSYLQRGEGETIQRRDSWAGGRRSSWLEEGTTLEEEDLSEKKGKAVNPWAICTASVGREDKDKYESCIKKVKSKHKIKKENA